MQPGDEDLQSEAFSAIAGRPIVVEEKLDGANAAISFAADGTMRLQSRGHFLTGGPRERHFDLLKSWASSISNEMHAVLTDRYVVYGEWLYAKHTIFYDALPHYFMEFDVLDTRTGNFLSTSRRRQLLAGLPITSVPVLHDGQVNELRQLTDLVGPSLYKTANWCQRLHLLSIRPPHRSELIQKQTDLSDHMEGLYIKVEEDDVVTARYKWVRASFSTTVYDSEGHWLSRPILRNELADNSPLKNGQ